ncbi:DUF7133 domain-containing protein [Postechiella marina]
MSNNIFRNYTNSISNNKIKPLLLVLLSLLMLLTNACKQESYNEPIISLEKYHIKEGFNLEVVASEPFIEAPVTMDFDNQGRMWVVEMRGYMQNLEGTGDDMPNGRITILQDLDNDGITDHSKIFLDSLVLPRAIAHVYGGLLYAEPPNLWFVDIENDKPANRVLVDSLYSGNGNVEHQPNGLMMHIDNWIYNAKSKYRYQKKNNKWIKEATTFRGQWGITKDNFGRLYYNTNSTQLIGDYVLPNTIIKNTFYKPEEALSKKLTPNQRVYPLHPTAINRGYIKGRLDKDSILVNVTSACSPIIYRGDKYPESFKQNAFVCTPEANAVKRNILNFSSNKITAKQAVVGKEFIASTDEGFRPVNLFNAPDGNMYIVDMHRGILQDKVFLTPYLKKLYAKKKLDTIIGMGRILKVTNQNNTNNTTLNIANFNTTKLVKLLYHNNGWFRDRAQQLLITQKDKNAIPLLKNVLNDTSNSIAQIHAMHTLNGFNALNFELLEKILYSNGDSSVISHALVLLEQFAHENKVTSVKKITEHLFLKNNTEIDLYTILSLGRWVTLSKDDMFPALWQISNKYKKDLLYQEALINSLRGLEEDYFLYLNKNNKNSQDNVFTKVLDTTLTNKKNYIKNSVYGKKGVKQNAKSAGQKIFKNLCATCHGINGEGVENLAPPLKNSEYISKSSKRLALVILHGLSGPIHVNGKLYELNTTMPGLVNNPDFSDKDIFNIIKYLQNTFSDAPKPINLDQIKKLRNIKPKNGGVFSETELLELEK